ncbi:methionyl-tRNA formyltransferase [Nitratifractor sp.]|uniref:methionyl-tRNA formyltransferase n=1 Tax=Nitratifractor sp. TaxID=2268144 RepID=UPI0025F29A2B|nr:methionyl-tRNA formyltransferase [Nitratifractor sp.]
MKRIVFMGTPDYARRILERLIEEEGIDVVLVLTQPDRPVGRKKVLTPPPVKTLATEKGIEVLQPESLREEGIWERLRTLAPDYIIVAAYGQLLPKAILDLVPCINLHASLLPAYRGASPVQQALLNGDSFTGVTAMLMEEGLDSGPALAYRYVAIGKETRLQSLMEQLTEAAAELTPKVLKRFEELQPLPQFGALASHCKKIRRSDGEITLDDAEAIERKYRAFEGWPGIFLSDGLKLNVIEVPDVVSPHRPGEILAIGEEAIDVGCRRGVLRIVSLQPAGKKAMSGRAYCVGRGLKVGDSLL